MDYDIPYYVLDNDGNIKSSTEPYIDDDDLKELLISLLGDDVSSDEIQKILDASGDEELSEEDFDKFFTDDLTFLFRISYSLKLTQETLLGIHANNINAKILVQSLHYLIAFIFTKHPVINKNRS